MKILLPLLIILSSCAHSGASPDKDMEIAHLQSQVDDLKRDIVRHDYYIDHEKCFITYNTCKVDKKNNCWDNHERCVINVWKQYKGRL